MSLALRQQRRTVERGIDTSLTVAVYDTATGDLQIPTAGTVTIYDQSTVLVSGASATSLGGSASAAYTLTGATSTGWNLSDQYLEVWSLTIGGTVYTFQLSGCIARRAYYATITDADLIAKHSALASLRPPDLTTFGTYIDNAGAWIERKLLQRGRRPELIFEPWALYDAHVFYALHLIFNDFASSLGQGRYADLSIAYETKAERELKSASFRYDTAQTGTMDTPNAESYNAVLTLTAGPMGRGYGRY